MSSPLGHSLAALTISALDRQLPGRIARAPLWWLWSGWLTVIGVFPDVDYITPLLPVVSPDGQVLRGTHSLAFALALPVLTALVLPFFGWGPRRWLTGVAQALGAGLSHLLLDFLVASRPMPLLYPFRNDGFGQPYHLLPSGGELTFGYLPTFQNLAIETGILVPLFVAILALVYRVRLTRRLLVFNIFQWCIFIGLCWASFWLAR